MDYETLLIERHDAVTLIRLNRPQALNALNAQVLADLIAAFAAYDADPSQRCAGRSPAARRRSRPAPTSRRCSPTASPHDVWRPTSSPAGSR